LFSWVWINIIPSSAGNRCISAPLPGPEFRHLLYVGSENPRKNLPFLIRALAQLQRRVPNVRLLKVGSPENLPQYQQLKQQIAALHLEDQVIFFEHLSQEDLTALYSAVDGFVFPSLYEGFGFPPLEAMACGAPVVCSTAASLPEVVGDAALAVDPRDLPGWVDAMERILLDDQLRARVEGARLGARP
jgi:glycosyltransferase involved in cell wall biosynthesis